MAAGPVLMTFDGDRLETKEVQVKKDFHLVIVDLQAHKDTMEILNRLNRCYPIAENETEAQRPAAARSDQQRNHPPGDQIY